MKLFFKPWFSGELKRLARRNAIEGKSSRGNDAPLSVLEDAVFKAMLTSDTEDSREALRLLLSACIRREISAVRVVNNELLPAHLAAKSARLDVNVTFNNGEVADLEMQIGKSDDDLKTRSALYTAMLLSAQSKRGKPYTEIKRVYQIFFLNCVLFPYSGKLPRRYSYREETEGDRLTEAVEIIFYELPKLEFWVRDYLAGKAGTENLSNDEKWCIFMKYRHEKRAESLIRELCRKEEGIMKAERSLAKVDRDYVKFVRNMNIMKNSMDRASFLYNGGKAEGKAEANLEIARKMKNAGLSSSEIEEFTGLSSDAIGKITSP